MLKVFVQVIGIFAFISIVFSFQNNNRKKILKFQILGNLLFSIHFFLIGSPTGSILNFLGILRGIVFNKRNEKKSMNNIIIMYIFIITFITAGYLTWEGIFSLLPTIGAVLGTIGFWMKNPRYIRFLCLTASPFWLIYNIHGNSVAGIINEIFVLVSLIIAIIRFEFLKIGIIQDK